MHATPSLLQRLLRRSGAVPASRPTHPTSRKRHDKRIHFESLEPRLLLSADLGEAMAAAAQRRTPVFRD